MAKRDIFPEDILYYGRCYEEGRQLWWFDLEAHRVISTEELEALYGRNGAEPISEDSAFLPLFQTNMLQLQKAFMQDFPEHTVEKIMAARKVSYAVAFNIFVETPPEIFRRWKDFEREHLLQDAVAWCKANRLPYRRKDASARG